MASTLKRGGVKDDRITELLPVLTAMLVNAIGTEGNRSLLSPEGKTGSWSELILYKKEGTGFSRHIIDRMYQGAEGKLVIVDYKSGEDSPDTRQKWQEQLASLPGLGEWLGVGRGIRHTDSPCHQQHRHRFEQGNRIAWINDGSSPERNRLFTRFGAVELRQVAAQHVE